MKELAAAATAFGLFWAWREWEVELAVTTVVLIVLISGILALAGARLGHRAPTLSASLVWLWNVAVVVSVGAVVSLVAFWLATFGADEPKEPDPGEATYFALGAAAFAALSERILKTLNRFSAGWLSKRACCPVYQREYEQQPSGPPKKVVAYRSVRDFCSSEEVGFGDLRSMLKAVQAAKIESQA